MAWTNGNALKSVATVAWADETRAAIAWAKGQKTANGTTGYTVNLPAAVSATTEYVVEVGWEEDPGPNSGNILFTKGLASFTIWNSGTSTGKTYYYNARKVPTLP